MVPLAGSQPALVPLAVAQVPLQLVGTQVPVSEKEPKQLEALKIKILELETKIEELEPLQFKILELENKMKQLVRPSQLWCLCSCLGPSQVW